MIGCFQISTGKFLEAQSSPSPGTMIANAVLAGYSENDLVEREVSDAEFAQIITPTTTVQALVFLGVVRFTVAANAVTVTADTIGISAVLRVSAGRYRVYTQTSSSAVTLPKVTILDTVVKNARISARTAAYVEVRVVDGSNVAVDATEVILELNRVVTS